MQGSEPESVIPRGLQVIRHGSQLEIVHSRDQSQSFFSIMFILVCAVFVLYQLPAFLFSQKPLTIFSLLALMVGIYMVGVLIYSPNKKHIYVSEKKLTVVHKPLPWFGNRDFPAADIEQLYAKRIANTEGPDSYEIRIQLLDIGG